MCLEVFAFRRSFIFMYIRSSLTVVSTLFHIYFIRFIGYIVTPVKLCVFVLNIVAWLLKCHCVASLLSGE